MLRKDTQTEEKDNYWGTKILPLSHTPFEYGMKI